MSKSNKTATTGFSEILLYTTPNGNVKVEIYLQDENSVCRNFRHTAADNKTYATQFYNLNAIISVGYQTTSAHKPQTLPTLSPPIF